MPVTDTETRHAVSELFSYIQAVVERQDTVAAPEFADESLQRLSDAVQYLAENIRQVNSFLRELCEGNINAAPPPRDNFLAGELKDLQAGLLHLVWQANQVAAGDYGQNVHFLGEFSAAFNQMTRQLEDREKELKRRVESASRSKKLLAAVLNGVKDWVFVVDSDVSEIVYTNSSAASMLENSEFAAISGKMSPLYKKLISDCRPESARSEEFVCPQSGRVFFIDSYLTEWLDRNACVHIVSDITDERAHEEHLEDIAFKDALTGLYNRWFCIKTLDSLIKKRCAFSLCYIDLDNLKYVNDTFGHRTGDEYITLAAKKLKSSLRSGDILCRIGGDEFVLLLPNCGESPAQRKLQRIRDELAAASDKFTASISFGVIDISGENKLTSDQILARADRLMYDYKKIHRNARR